MPPIERWSLQRRLLGGLLAILALSAAGLFFLLARYADRAAERAYDRLLLASALTIADALQVQDGQVTLELPYAALAILATGRQDRIFYRVQAPDGATVTGYGGLGEALAPASSPEPRFVDLVYRGTPVRAAELGRFVAGAGGSGWITILVAHTGEERAALAREILRNAFGPALVILVIAGVLIVVGIRRALAPLAVLDGLIRERSPADLRPIEASVPSEVQQLLATLNRLMQRLQASLEHMQTFIADAAHQIRTPLASLRSQAEMATEEDDAAALRRQVLRIHHSAVFASQLTTQLLSHATVTHRADLERREPVDLAALVQQVVRRAAAGAEELEIALDLDRLDAPAMVTGDPVTLREAVSNLVDNAAKYAGRYGPVELRLERQQGRPTIRLEVADRGPGIPDADKSKALQRFSRGRQSGEVVGSGLGLAIVKAAADAHGAKLRLLDRPGGGLIVRLDLPALEGE
jgi:two-component system sensor histidine kinase TctE